MAKLRLGVQLFTLRNETKDSKNLSSVFEFVKSTGAETVELSRMPVVPAKVLAKLAQDNGLSICSTHSSPEIIRDDLDKLIEEHLIYGCPTIGVASIPSWFDKNTLDGVKRFAEFMNNTQERCKKSGLYMHYHNHAFEFKKLEDKPILDILYDEMTPDIGFCLDLFWVKVGKADISLYIDKLGTRLTQIHMKGYKKFLFLFKMASPSEGLIDYPFYLKQAEKYGTKDALVEIDIIKDPRAAVKKGIEFLIENYKKK